MQQLVCEFFSVHKRKHLKGRLVAQNGPFVGVDMGQDKVNILLRQVVEGSALGQNRTKEPMVAFNVWLLIRGHGIAVEDTAAQATIRGKFNGLGVGEFRTVVGQKHGEQPFKVLPAQPLIENAETIGNRSGGIVVPQKGQHEFSLREDEGKQNFSTDSADNGVHLDIGAAGILGSKKAEIFDRSAITTGLIDFRFFA